LNNVIENLHNRSSIRKYKKQTVPTKLLTKILSAATKTSSSGNMQCYSVIVTTNQDLKEKLLEPHFNQHMVAEAPALITFCADFNRMRRWLELSDAPENFDNFMSFMIAAIDATLASQSAALAAEAEGLGICYLGSTLASCDRISEILNCPENVVPIVGFTLGYPNETPQKRERLPLEAILHHNKYQHFKDEEILNCYNSKEASGFKRYQDIPELREMIEKLNIQNLAQVYTKAKYTKQSHIEYSESVLNFIKKQNFFNFK
jgi:nitroreductase